ncbi:MAG: hypothetical protein KGI50_00325 [Patescibacteria group bacterium]|nr:hypothetical protein [Patescibacteria group bacterium]MDE2438195.1 hypothetical protein [Patescibacteria group bacterium]
MNFSKKLYVLVISGVWLCSSYGTSLAAAQSQITLTALQQQVNALKNAEENNASKLQILKLNKNILDNLYSYLISEDDNLGKSVTNATLASSTQNKFLDAIWNDEQWYLAERKITASATSTDAIKAVVLDVKQHRQEIQDILQKQITGILLVNDAERARAIAVTRFNQVSSSTAQLFLNPAHLAVTAYLSEIKSQLDEIQTTTSETRLLFETLSTTEDYTNGLDALSRINGLLQNVYDEFIAIGNVLHVSGS